jgi:hypothetical protein
MFWTSADNDGCRFSHHCCRRTSQHQLNIEVDKHILISILIYWISLNPSTAASKKWIRKATRHSDGVDWSNPRRWRGERLHHHGSGVCWLFVLLWMDLWCHELIVCNKWYKHNLKMRLTHYFLIHIDVHHTVTVWVWSHMPIHNLRRRS